MLFVLLGTAIQELGKMLPIYFIKLNIFMTNTLTFTKHVLLF
jgi:hypothetical protein